jgi:hypothetical protein
MNMILVPMVIFFCAVAVLPAIAFVLAVAVNILQFGCGAARGRNT